MIEVRNLTKQYDSLVAVRDVSFRVSEGTVLGLLGPNGAGKTTTLRMLAGVLGPTAGTIRLCGLDLVSEPILARRNLGYLPENAPLYPEMSVRQYLSYRAALKGTPHALRKRTLDDAAQMARCADVLDLPIAHVSRGYRQRVGLADVLLTKPRILLLDEPTAGLDPNQVRDLRELVQRLRAQHTILISTHVLAEVDALCTNVLVMHQGRLVAHSTLSELRELHQGVHVRFTLRDPYNRADSVLTELGWRRSDAPAVPNDGTTVHERSQVDVSVQLISPLTAKDLAIEQLVAALVRADVGVQAAYPETTSLEAVFSQLTQASPSGAQ